MGKNETPETKSEKLRMAPWQRMFSPEKGELRWVDGWKLALSETILSITDFCKNDVKNYPWRKYIYVPLIGAGILATAIPGPNIIGIGMMAAAITVVAGMSVVKMPWAVRAFDRIKKSMEESHLLEKYRHLIKGDDDTPDAEPSDKPAGPKGRLSVNATELIPHTIKTVADDLYEMSPEPVQKASSAANDYVIGPVHKNVLSPIFQSLGRLFSSPPPKAPEKPSDTPPSMDQHRDIT